MILYVKEPYSVPPLIFAPVINTYVIISASVTVESLVHLNTYLTLVRCVLGINQDYQGDLLSKHYRQSFIKVTGSKLTNCIDHRFNTVCKLCNYPTFVEQCNSSR